MQVQQQERTDVTIRQIHTEISKQINFLKGIFHKFEGTGIFDYEDTKALKSALLDIDHWLDMLKLLPQRGYQASVLNDEAVIWKSEPRVDEGGGQMVKYEDTMNVENIAENQDIINSARTVEMDDLSPNDCKENQLNTQIEQEVCVKIELDYSDFYKNFDKNGESESNPLRESQSNVNDSEREKSEIQMEFTCDRCGALYFSRNDAIHHEEIHESISFVCFICNQSFQQLNTLQKHLRTHIESSSHKFSGSTFHQTRHLNQHLRTRSAECYICGKQFTKRWNLQRHSRTHSGEKPFKCDVCGKEFAARSNLQKHSRTHSGKKPFKCDICGKEFAARSNLQRHSRTHSGEKPFKSDVRRKAFAQSSTLGRHLRSHGGKKPV